MQKIQTDLIIAVKVLVSAPYISVLATQTALTDKIYVGPRHLPKILGHRGKNNHQGDSLRAINNRSIRDSSETKATCKTRVFREESSSTFGDVKRDMMNNSGL